MKKILTILTLSFTIGAASSANATADTAPDYYKISAVKITEEIPTAVELASNMLPPEATPELNSFDFTAIDWNTMVLLGQKLVQIIEAGKPIVNIKRDAVSVVPAGISAWEQLSGWQAPVSKVYRVEMENGLGMSVVDIRLKVSALWGGGYNGKGNYLSNVVASPTAVTVLWGYQLDLWTEQREPVNTGTLEQPVAGLGFEIRYRSKTPFAETTGAQEFFIKGDGQILEM